MDNKLAYNLIPASHHHAIPIWPVAKSGLDEWLQAHPAAIAAWLNSQKFKAESGQIVCLPAPDGSIHGVVLGLGDSNLEEPDPWTFARLAEQLPPATYRIAAGIHGAAAEHALLGWALASYRFDRYKDHKDSGQAVLMAPKDADIGAIERIVRATFLVRDLINTPAGDMGPQELEDAAHRVASGHGVSISSLAGKALLERGFNAIHTVGKASSQAPRLIDFTWGRPDAPKVTIVGKGVCFDSGGLDIKSSSGMRIMKKDMGGAAHALALADMIMSAGLDLRLRVLIPAVENAISGDAFRPGDIIRTYKGLSVEVGDTDAEGRLILCDALALADEEKPELMLDFATLTGAARVALGPDVPVFFTDDHKLAADLSRLSIGAADPVWRLPLWSPYGDHLKSGIADLNSAPEWGFAGAIIAALYLKKFVTQTASWLHFDLYAWNSSNRAGRPVGGEAMALRTTFALLAERYKARKNS